MKIKHLLLSALVLGSSALSAQEIPSTNKKGGNYQFEIIKSMDATDVHCPKQRKVCRRILLEIRLQKNRYFGSFRD